MATASIIPTELEAAPAWAHDAYHNAPVLLGYDDIAAISRMSRGSIANLHSEGQGPQNGLLMGRKRVFPRLDAILWLVTFAEAKPSKGRAAA